MMIHLDCVDQLPDNILALLRGTQIISLFRSTNYMDNLIKIPEIIEIAEKVEEHISKTGVSGYHCTKEIEDGYFLKNGLRVLNIHRHIDKFLSLISNRVSREIYDKFESTLTEWMNHPQISNRENLLFFCMSRYQVVNCMQDYSFKYYGGEAIYWPFDECDECLKVLESLGHPVVVEVRLNPSELNTYRLYPFSRDILSHFAARYNPDFYIDSCEASIDRDVRPDEISSVTHKDDFFASNESLKRS